MLEAETARQPSHQTPLTSQHHTTVISPDGGPCSYWGNGPETGSPMEIDNTDSKLPQLSFDEDSDLELQTRYVDITYACSQGPLQLFSMFWLHHVQKNVH